MNTKNVSIIVPFLNEADTVSLFCKTLDEYRAGKDINIELVFVDDGSTDNTVELLRAYTFSNIDKVKIVQLSKNYGSHAAVRAGILNASYDAVTWMGCDLQEPLELIEIGLNKMIEGYDAVYFEKKTVQVGALEKLFSNTYSSLMRKYAVKNFESGGINTIMINNKIVDMLNNNIESNSSVILQILDAGFKHITIPMDYKERAAGVSKWTLSKKIKLFIDSFVAFSFMPIRLVSIVGMLMFFVGFIVGVATIINKIVNPSVPIGYSTLVGVMAMGFGITNISLGIIAEYLWRAYDAARKRPAFIISNVYDLTWE